MREKLPLYGVIVLGLVSALTALSIVRFGILNVSLAAQVDSDLAKVVKQINLRPLQVRRFEADPIFKLGQALFFDPVVSGPRDVACATCHLLRYGTSDGLAKSIGVHGVGLGPKRRLAKPERQHRRHSLSLWNRDNNATKALFWDGRVEVLDSQRRIFRSPLGEELPKGLQNALAVQSLFPLVAVEEMLGDPDDKSSANLPNGHAGLPNDLVKNDPTISDASRMKETHLLLMTRLLGGSSATEWQQQYRELFRAAYPSRDRFTIVDFGNAVAHFEEMAFATRESAWDHYLSGQSGALNEDAKRGALLFYGKARCAVCHNGPLLSDFRYHSIGVFDESPRRADTPEDFGRWEATHDEADRYKFRTPPLRNVTKTSPYFHNGSEPSLRGAIIRHLDPLDKANKYNPDGSFALSLKQINAVSQVLLSRIELSEKEIDALIAFLTSLDYEPKDVDIFVPKNVPSGLPVEYE
jgi:cytochrome c peroxidase